MEEIQERIREMPDRCKRVVESGGAPVRSALWYCNSMINLIKLMELNIYETGRGGRSERLEAKG